jgi:hypothetical protein
MGNYKLLWRDDDFINISENANKDIECLVELLFCGFSTNLWTFNASIATVEILFASAFHQIASINLENWKVQTILSFLHE